MATREHRIAPDPNETGWPSGIKYIIGNEGCERFSYYGMRAILYAYIVTLYVNLRGLDPSEAKAEATQAYHLFTGGVYALPIIGAILADRLLGKYLTILWLSIVYCLGHAALAVFESAAIQESLFGTVLLDPMDGLTLGLVLIAIGSGGIKPCVSAHVGDQFGKGNWHLVPKVYNAFYFIINFGSAFATIIIPEIRGAEVIDPATGYISYEGSVSWAFGVPGILMGLATFFFWLGRHDFVHVPPSHPGKLGLLDTLASSALFMVAGWPWFFHDVFETGTLAALSGVSLGAFVLFFTVRQSIERDDGFLAVLLFALFKRNAPATHPNPGTLSESKFWGPAAREFGTDVVEGPIAVLKIISVFFLVSVFWALFDQHGSTWVEQAKGMDRVLDFDQAGWLSLAGIVGAVIGAPLALAFRKDLVGRAAIAAAFIGLGLYLGFEAAARGVTYELKASQVQAMNPFMVMVLIPLTQFGLYPLLSRLGLEPTPLRRMTLGMLTAAFAFVIVALIQHRIDEAAVTGDSVHVLWQVPAYLVITLAEVMVSITGLEFAYTQAPKRMKSIIMGFWLLFVALGNLLVVFLAGFEDLAPATFFWVFAGLMAGAGVLFGLRAAFYTYRDYTQ